MNIITIDDVRDDILAVNENDVNDANWFVTDIGLRLGVAEKDFASPPRFTIRRLAIAYACYIAALRMVGTDGSVIFNGQENVDIYAQKLKFFRAEVDSISTHIVASDFSDMKKTAGRTIELGRG